MELFNPYDTPEFHEAWRLWKQYKKEEFGFRYKSKISEQAALRRLARLSSNAKEAILIIEQSMEFGYRGFFELKKTSNGKNWIAELNQAAKRAAGE